MLNTNSHRGRPLLTAFIAAIGMTYGSAFAASHSLPEQLKICAAGNEMPYSNRSEQGFENKIARILGEQLQIPVEFVWSDRAAIFLVTEHLLRNECDVVIGVDENDPRVATSEPYYTSGYVFVYKDNGSLNVQDWQSPDLKKLERFAVVPGSPSEIMLREIGKYETNFNYGKSLFGFKSPRNQYIRLDPEKLVNEVITGNADIAHLWAPEVARYVHNAREPLTMVMSPAKVTVSTGEEIVHHYPQSIAVREDDQALLNAINQALSEAQPRIRSVLEEEGIPLL